MFRKSNLVTVVVVLTLALSVLAVVHGLQGHATVSLNAGTITRAQETDYNDDLPIYDPSSPGAPDEKREARRRAKGEKYRNPSFPISEEPYNISHVLEGSPTSPLPVEQSKLIVIGKVANAEAVLSNDGSSVYSEFTLRVNEVLKNDLTESIEKGDALIVERRGGRLKHPSGKFAVERVIGTRMPLVGRVYLLFLVKHPEDSLYIYGAYQLSGNQAVPLDDYQQNPFQKYKGVLWSTLLADLKLAISNNLTVPATPD